MTPNAGMSGEPMNDGAVKYKLEKKTAGGMAALRAEGKDRMFGLRRSMKSSSSENEGEDIQTPTSKCVRVPLGDVLPRQDLTNSISKRRSEAVSGSNLTPLMRRLHLQDEGLLVPKLCYEDPIQEAFVKKDCVDVPQARDLNPLVTHTTEPRLNSVIPEFMPTEGEDSALVCVHGTAIPSPVQKGELVTKAQEDPKLSLADTAITSGLARHRSSTSIETVVRQTVTSSGPKAGVGSPLPTSLEIARQPDAFQSNPPGVVTESSWSIVPEMEEDEALVEATLQNFMSADGLSTTLDRGPMGVGMGKLSRVEVGKAWQFMGDVDIRELKQQERQAG
ncbi:uncharacterized protein LOC121282890 [Carcharodon carcharias]|uniref:uncharacterized protein LOC121282890 n=1 Tax=Carcharodon carcharias TaxID=13397 RepID=UPI001B7DFEBC|nr:uncharacterized protein LOC121282890 [Carcharodon carcharias]